MKNKERGRREEVHTMPCGVIIIPGGMPCMPCGGIPCMPWGGIMPACGFPYAPTIAPIGICAETKEEN